MPEEIALARLREAGDAGYGHLVCVPAAIQFLLPDGLEVPPTLFEKARQEDGLLPSQVLEELRARGWIDYAFRSVPKEEMRNFALSVKQMIGENTVLGIGVSLELKENHLHFVTVRGPLKYDKWVRAFDTRYRNPMVWTNLDQLLHQSISSSRYGKYNIVFIYPGVEYR